jgi:truncated hemoglobin YjbI
MIPLNIPNTVVLWILKQDFGKRKLCARFVPHSMTPEQRENWDTSCQEITLTDADKNSFNKIIMGDENGCFAYDPKTKRQSYE